jgi:hypothetical protein
LAIDPKRYPPGKNPAGAPGSPNVDQPGTAADEESANEPSAASPEEQAKLDMAKAGLLGKLNDRVKLRTAQRKDVELRWLQDLRQYHGKYEPEKLSAIKEAGGSQEFVNITRSKTNTFAARVADMLLPTDDKNWGLEPTPVPELEAASENAVALKDPATGQPLVTADGHEVQARDAATGLKRVAELRCAAMEREVEDQLAECKYNAVQRDVIDDMALYGTGILKGPVLTSGTKRRWHQVGVDSKGVAQYELEVLEETRPTAEKVSVWNFFPDMSVTDVKKGEDILERHPSTRKDLIDLAKLPGFDRDALRDLIRLGPQNSTLWYLNELRAISNQEVIDAAKTLWEVWEWHGPLDSDELRACGLDAPDDPLLLVDAVVWFCDNQILKATLNPMDTGDRPYSVCYCEKDDTSVFGFGYPYLLRNPQNVANGAWRMLIDNAGLSVGPQIIVNRKVIEPADGDYKLKPRKVWEIIQDGVKVDDAFKAVTIDAHQTELLKLFELATSQADVETNLPLIAQGIESPEQPDSATGLSIFNNNASVVLRRSVKSYDDDMTGTFIPRMYDWNMQFNPKEDIKGDWRCIAKGAGVLMEKERMAQALVKAIEVMSKDPDARIIVNKERVYEGWFRAMRLDDAMNTEDEKAKVRKQIADEQAAAARAQQGNTRGTDPAMVRIAERKQDLAEKEFFFEAQAHEDDFRFKITALAETLGLDEKKVLAGLAEVRLKLDGRARELNAKAGFHARTGEAV